MVFWHLILPMYTTANYNVNWVLVKWRCVFCCVDSSAYRRNPSRCILFFEANVIIANTFIEKAVLPEIIGRWFTKSREETVAVKVA